jgi:hypothetical protein
MFSSRVQIRKPNLWVVKWCSAGLRERVALSLPPRENAGRRWHLWRIDPHQTGTPHTLNLGFSASRTVRNVFVVYKPLCWWHFVRVAQTGHQNSSNVTASLIPMSLHCPPPPPQHLSPTPNDTLKWKLHVTVVKWKLLTTCHELKTSYKNQNAKPNQIKPKKACKKTKQTW